MNPKGLDALMLQTVHFRFNYDKVSFGWEGHKKNDRLSGGTGKKWGLSGGVW